jgi:hypothetical protein
MDVQTTMGGENMVDKLLAFCGLTCTECPAYIAQQTNDQALRMKTANDWSSDDFPVAPDQINCEGCTTVDGDRWTWCQQCAVRVCAADCGVTTCAMCPDYGCEKLEAFLEMAGEEARQRLESLRRPA